MDFKVGQVYEHAEDGLMEVTEVRDDGFRVKDLSTLEAKYEKALKEVEELGAMIKDAKVEKDSIILQESGRK